MTSRGWGGKTSARGGGARVMRGVSGMNREIARLAASAGPARGRYAAHWAGEVEKLAASRCGMPDESQVCKGVLRHPWYGRSASVGAHTVLYTLETQDGKAGLPRRRDFSLEHMLPRTPDHAWQESLGPHWKEIHGRCVNAAGNMTLLTEAENSSAGNRPFPGKCAVYRGSRAVRTRAIAEEAEWGPGAIEKRSAEIAEAVLAAWPWEGRTAGGVEVVWRLDGETRRSKGSAALVLDVAQALIERGHGDTLTGGDTAWHLFRADKRPETGTGRRMRPVPGCEGWLASPYGDGGGECAARHRVGQALRRVRPGAASRDRRRRHPVPQAVEAGRDQAGRLARRRQGNQRAGRRTPAPGAVRGGRGQGARLRPEPGGDLGCTAGRRRGRRPRSTRACGRCRSGCWRAWATCWGREQTRSGRLSGTRSRGGRCPWRERGCGTTRMGGTKWRSG